MCSSSYEIVFPFNCKVLLVRDCLHIGLSSSEVVFLQYRVVLEGGEDGLDGWPWERGKS